LVGAAIGGGGEELCEEAAVGAVELDTVIAYFLQKFGGVRERVGDFCYFLVCCSVKFGESHSHYVTSASLLVIFNEMQGDL
jgi:hypothetical protein